MKTAVRSGAPGTWVPMVHRNCPHNELQALCLRVLAPLPPGVHLPLTGSVARVFGRLRSVARRFGGHKWSNLETALSYQGALQRRYLKAAESLRSERVTPKDARLSCFLKAEKTNPVAKLAKPRMIFPRDPRYNLELASRLKPFEHWLWGYLTGRRLFRGGDNTRVVAKGLSPARRAHLISRKFNSFRDCVVFEVDGKAFEAHVGESHLQAEHGVYRSAFPSDKGLARLLREQLSLSGRLPCGAKFSRPGGRASGDFNTGMGNTLLMLAICVGVLSGYGCRFDILADGDNALIFLEASESQVVLPVFAADVLQASGHEFTLERPVRRLEEIRFGQSAPVDLGGTRGLTMVRNYLSVLSGSASSHRYLNEPVYSREWLCGVASCELSLARGIPVLQAWALNLLRATEFSGRVRCGPFREYFMQGAWLAGPEEAEEITPVARASFEAAFGVSAEQQVALEESFALLSFGGSYERIDSCYLSDLPPGIVEDFLDSSV